MTWRERLSRLDAIQKGRPFKLIASALIVLAALGLVLTYVLASHTSAEMPSAPAPAAAPGPDVSAEEKNAIESTQRIMREILSGRQDPTSIAAGAAVGGAIALAVVWLGLGLTYLALIVAGLAPALVLGLVFKAHGLAWIIGGIVALTASFAAPMRALKVAYGAPNPVFAVARNVLDEASRLKISLIFIILLIAALALLPATLDAEQPLRYRVQTFLSFAMSGSFWIIATLVVLFSVATVAFEQRDKVIWQTMTKPVAPWQYVVGKWIGIGGLAAVLLAVAGSGVFLFTEHLRTQPADGEDAAISTPMADAMPSEDRFILETQILSARRASRPEPLALDEDKFRQNKDEIVKGELAARTADFTNPAAIEAERERLLFVLDKELRDAYQQQYRAIEPARSEVYRFTGLGAAKRNSEPLILRFKVNTGNAAPNEIYKVSFQFRGGDSTIQEVVLGQFHTVRLNPAVVDDEGALEVMVVNGDINTGVANGMTISFPPDAFEVSYAASTFAANFARILFVLWVKLAFLSILSIAAATFLSFPVACLVSFGSFLAAESATFLQSSLESFATESADGKETYYLRVPIAAIGRFVSWLFSTYSELDPTRRVVEGILMPWGEVAKGLLVLATWIALLFLAAILIFRKRELATYSGH